MPVIIRNGKQYRMSLLTGSVREERPPPYSRNTPPWTPDDDRILRELKTSRISWERISMVMDDKPIAELRKRWLDIQSGRNTLRTEYRLDEMEEDHQLDERQEREEYERERYGREERRVSFSPSADEDEEEDKTRKIYYMDDQFTLDEVLLLHQIAADWKKNRWETISSRFNDRTGRNITADQAKTVVDD
ncbi:SANT/Myb-like DNA-binding domain-containing protein [Aspergillus stella-maris]|uniref:SANT/Myb-like DNA-binding domain-containing protein n=1 Tax=Aspergillus stella-maris TaxID=1810926 RepID=UPI003CCE13D1